MPATEAPPIPPQIAAQQQGPLASYAGATQGQGMSGAQAAVQQVPSVQMAQGLLKGIGEKIQSLAKLLVSEYPDLIPVIKPAVQSLSMLEKEFEKKSQSGGKPGANSPNVTGGGDDSGQGDPEPPGAISMAS
jgi:cytochrome c556